MRDALVFFWFYLRTVLLARRFRSGSRARLEAWQEKRVLRHVRFVRARSPFYRTLWKGIPDASWRTFPVIDKAAMMENFSLLNTVGVDREEAFALALRAERTRDFTPDLGGVTVGLSSGTSGHRGLFLVTRAEAQAWAGAMLAKILPRPLWKPARIAFFLRAGSNLYQSVNKGSIQLRYFDMMAPLEDHLAALVTLDPTLIIAPPQVLRALADAVSRGELSLRVEKIVSAAETLDPLDEAHMTAAFGCPIHQGYQATEGFLGASCAHGTLHVNEDLVHVEREYVDAASRRFMPIVTDFRRRSQPIVRYRLNDILTERKQPCPCGSRFLALECIEGRADDVFHFALDHCAEQRWLAIYPDFIRRSVISASSSIERYMAVQNEQGDVIIHLCMAPEADGREVEESVLRELTAICKSLGARLPLVSFQTGIPPLEGRKLRRVVSHFRPVQSLVQLSP